MIKSLFLLSASLFYVLACISIIDDQVKTKLYQKCFDLVPNFSPENHAKIKQKINSVRESSIELFKFYRKMKGAKNGA